MRALAAAVLPRATRPTAVLVHMVPLFALLAAPLVKPLRIPMLLWYTHWNPSRSLRLALPLVDVVISVSRGSFPIATPKLQATGHAIDVAQFSPAAGSRQRRSAAPARPRPDGALEGLRHDAGGARPRRPARLRRRGSRSEGRS